MTLTLSGYAENCGWWNSQACAKALQLKGSGVACVQSAAKARSLDHHSCPPKKIHSPKFDLYETREASLLEASTDVDRTSFIGTTSRQHGMAIAARRSQDETLIQSLCSLLGFPRQESTADM